MNLQLRPALVSFVALSVITGLAYPALITGLSKVIFPKQAAGSLIKVDGKVIGSELIGQSFTAPRDFWSRPSATVDANSKPLPYNGANSGGSNLAPSNPDLKKAVEERIVDLRAADPDATGPVPVDLVTTSASGLDPHISPAGADYQVPRIARLRHLDPQFVRDLVRQHTSGRALGFIGEPCVNVLELNLDLQARTK